MNIIVCVKQVPDTTEIKIDPVKGTLIRDGVPSIMNPDDKGGLELALRFKEQYGATVTVVSMGPPQADRMLREALAMGADRAILLSDRRFAGADTLATSYALAGCIRTLDYDLIIAGRQAIDGDTAQVAPEMAQHLDLPQVSYVIDAEKTNNGFIVKKETEDSVQTLEVEGIIEAYKREVEVWSADQIDVEEEKLGLKGSPTKVHKSFPKSLKEPGEVFELSEEEAVELIVSRLKEKHII